MPLDTPNCSHQHRSNRASIRPGRSSTLGALFAATLAGAALGYSKPTVTAGQAPAGAPKDNRYFEIKTDGVDANNPVNRLYLEINPPTMDADGDGDIDEEDHPMKGKIAWNGAAPAGWSFNIVPYDNKYVLCFSRADNTTNVKTFKICVAPNGKNKAEINGTGSYYWFKLEDGQATEKAKGGGAGKIQLLALSDCCDPHAGPGCDDGGCATAVCSIDPFCCDVAWDGICAGEAADLCGVCASSPCNECCEADLNEDGIVNGADLGLMLGDWALGESCANFDGGPTGVDGGDLGVMLASWGACDGTTPCTTCVDSGHTCFTQGEAGCTDVTCCEAICAVDPFCCDTAWDGICVDQAIASCEAPPCGFACPPAAIAEGEPCGADLNGGCNSVPPVFGSIACGDIVCGEAWASGGVRDTDWYQLVLFAPTLIELSVTSQLPMVIGVVNTDGVPDCLVATSVDPFAAEGYCSSALVQACLPPGTWWLFAAPNGFDFFPCGGGDNGYWIALACLGPCSPAACGSAGHDCFTAGGPFCDDASCCNAVCAADPFCCDVAWDGICVDQAKAICGGGSNCCFANGGVGCDDPACMELVCSIDPFCCETAWDSICANEAAELCKVCGGGGSNCCFANGGVGCDDPACTSLVCSIDPFCCETAWDSICANEAADLCKVCGGAPPAMAITDVFPSFVSQGDTLTITGFGFPSDPLDMCALVVGAPDEFGQTPPTVGLRVLAATPNQLTAVVNGVMPGGVTGMVMVAQGDGQQFTPPNPHPKFTWLAPGGWVWQSNGGPMASSAEMVTVSPASAVTCQQFFGSIDPGDGKAAVTITGGATGCPVGTTITFQFDATTLSGTPFSIDKAGTIQAIQAASLSQCADALCAAVQQLLNSATGQIWSCTSQIVGASIVLKIGAPGFEEFDPAKPFYFWVQICTP